MDNTNVYLAEWLDAYEEQERTIDQKLRWFRNLFDYLTVRLDAEEKLLEMEKAGFAMLGDKP